VTIFPILVIVTISSLQAHLRAMLNPCLHIAALDSLQSLGAIPKELHVIPADSMYLYRVVMPERAQLELAQR
jgi:hypothetical protein